MRIIRVAYFVYRQLPLYALVYGSQTTRPPVSSLNETKYFRNIFLVWSSVIHDVWNFNEFLLQSHFVDRSLSVDDVWGIHWIDVWVFVRFVRQDWNVQLFETFMTSATLFSVFWPTSVCLSVCCDHDYVLSGTIWFNIGRLWLWLGARDRPGITDRRAVD